jgi:hypothetical protein
MKRRTRKTKSIVGTLFLAGIICSSAYAFTAGVTFSSANAGDGTYTVSNDNVAVTYTLNADPSKIDKINLAFSGSPIPLRTAVDANSKVFVSPTGAAPYTSCTNTAATDNWVCTLAASVNVSTLTSLRVIAAD